MKIILFFLISSLVNASQCKLEWSANPPTENITGYRVYRIVGDQQTKIADIAAPTTAIVSTTIEAIAGDVIVVTAINAYGESVISDPAIIQLPPSKPLGLRVVEIQTSDNLKEWDTLAYVPLKDQSPKRFVRASITEINK